MTEKRMWTAQQDKTLKYLKEQLNLTKWSQIARKMKVQLNQKGKQCRNQKQCRDRYVNYLSKKEAKNVWSKQDQYKMIDLHRQIGNKWALISLKFEDVSQNFIKNQFYSRLRKSIRKINNLLDQKYRKPVKKFKLNVIFKLSNLVDGNQKIKKIFPVKLTEYYRDYLYQFINFSLYQEDFQKKFQNVEEMNIYITKPIYIVEDIYQICLNKSKRKKKNIYPILQKYLHFKKSYVNQIKSEKYTPSQLQAQKLIDLFIQQIIKELQICLFYLKNGELPKNQKQLYKDKNMEQQKNQIVQAQQAEQSQQKQQNCSKKNIIQQGIIEEQSIVQRLLYEQSPKSISGFGQKLSGSYGWDNMNSNREKSSDSSPQNCQKSNQKRVNNWSGYFDKSFSQKPYN